MIGLEQIYWLIGAMFGAIALLTFAGRANSKRVGSAAFWGLLAISFLFGSRIGDLANGFVVLGLVALGGSGALGLSKAPTASPAERESRAKAHGNAIFLPALLIPAIAIAGTFLISYFAKTGLTLFDPKQATLIALAAGTLIALAFAMLWLQPPPMAPLQEAGRLASTVGWAMILPQMLAALGAIFALANVGQAVGTLATQWLPLGHPFAAVTVYCLGMAFLTVLTGNAFAAFPVMTAAIGIPLIVHKFGGDPAVVGAVGMLSGFCGTLTTPMAANFNIVPAALLELPDRNAVIRVQIATAIPLLLANIVLMNSLAFHR